MADVNLLKYTGANYGADYTIANAVFSIKTAKNYTELERALTINHFSKLDVYDGTVAEQFSRFKRGFLQRALGQGIRYVETFGLLQTRPFTPAKPGEKVCLEIPNNVQERAEVIGQYIRVYCSSKQPDIMDAYDLFVDPAELYTFTEAKIGSVKQSVSVFLDLAFQYILGVDPWGDEHADHFNAFTIGAILGAKWQDTAIGQFGDDKTDGIGAMLKYIEKSLEAEISKEKSLPNVNEYNIWDWCPKFMGSPNPAQAKPKDPNYVAKLKKPTAALDSAKLKKLYYDNTKSDPNLAAASVSKCLSYFIDRMTTRVTAMNDSQFPGNIEDKAHEYGKTKDTYDHNACPAKGSTKRADTKSLFLPTKISRDELVIIMNSDLYEEIKSASMVSDSSEAGAYNSYIKSFLQYDDKIVKLDTMPYGAIKIGSALRYNHWDLYDKIEVDKLGQADVVVNTAHRGIVFGIREYQPFMYIRLHGLYVNPAVSDTNIEFKAAQEIK